MKFQKFGSDLLLMDEIASGGMAEVFLAKQYGPGGFDKTVALKRIYPHFAQQDLFKNMFEREVQISAQLQHPNIVQVYRAGEQEKYLYLVMEYVNGKNVSNMIESAVALERLIPLPLTLHIIAEVAKGLHYAHTFVDPNTNKCLKLVHRDISPPNIMLGYNGAVKIVDFGIAKAVTSSNLTETGMIKGKINYLAPEQINGVDGDPRSDIFALGIVMYELLTSRSLFSGTPTEVFPQILRCDVPDARQYNPKVNDDIAAILDRMLVANPAERYQSAEDVSRDAQTALSKHYSGFVSSDLGSFLKNVYATELEQASATYAALSKEALKVIEQGAVESTPSPTNAPEEVEATKVDEQEWGSEEKLPVSANGDRVPVVVERPGIPAWAAPGAALGVLLVLLFLGFKAMQSTSKPPVAPKPSYDVIAWLKPESTGLSEGAPVAVWGVYPSGRPIAAQQDPERQPTFSNGALRTASGIVFPGLKFDGKNDFLALDSLAPKIRETEALTLVFVAQAAADSKRQFIFSMHHESKRTADVARLGFANNGMLEFRIGEGQKTKLGRVDITQPAVYVLRLSPTHLSLFRNGVLVVEQKNQYTLYLGGTGYVSLGQEWDTEPSDLYHGAFGDVILLSGEIADNERIQLEHELGKKYEIPIMSQLPQS